MYFIPVFFFCKPYTHFSFVQYIYFFFHAVYLLFFRTTNEFVFLEPLYINLRFHTEQFLVLRKDRVNNLFQEFLYLQRCPAHISGGLHRFL